MQFRKTKTGIAICPFFIWTSENIEGLGHQENDVNLTYCNHPNNKNDFEANCQKEYCPFVNKSEELKLNGDSNKRGEITTTQ